jgi:type IV secretion system protein VirD4
MMIHQSISGPGIRSRTDGLIIGMRGDIRPRPMGFVYSDLPDHTGQKTGELVRYSGESHLMTFGVTGSGKTAGPVISNALDHPGPLICLECKGDVYEATAERRRQMGQHVVTLDLTGTVRHGDSFNPIDAFRRVGGDSTLTARSIAASIVPRGTSGEIFWLNWAETMLTGGIGFAMDHAPEGKQNIGHVFDMFNNDDVPYSLAVLLDTQGNKMDRSIYSAFAGFLQLPDKETRPSVLGSTQQHLMLWESDLIRNLTSHTSFDLDGLINGAPISLYIIVPPLRMTAYAPVLRLWLTGLLSALMTRQRRPRHRTLMMCDELGALGRVDAFVTASTLLRSAGLQLWSFWQNPSQLEIYGSDARTLVDNAGVLQFLGAKNHRMASDFASLVGGVSADQILEMQHDEQLVMIDGNRPERMKRVRYFEHPELRGLAPRR